MKKIFFIIAVMGFAGNALADDAAVKKQIETLMEAAEDQGVGYDESYHVLKQVTPAFASQADEEIKKIDRDISLIGCSEESSDPKVVSLESTSRATYDAVIVWDGIKAKNAKYRFIKQNDGSLLLDAADCHYKKIKVNW